MLNRVKVRVKGTHGALWSPKHIQQLPAPRASQLYGPKG